MSKLDYSKWDHIEVSDDEDDTHPNIDTPSLFRWRHQARVERDEQWHSEKKEFEDGLKAHLTKLENCKQKLEAAKRNSQDLAKFEEEMNQIKLEDKKWKEKEDDMKKKERLKPWNVDTICHESKTRTIINSAALQTEEPQSSEQAEEAAIERLKTFTEKNESLIRKFGLFQRPEDSQTFLLEQPHLVCEETANHLVLWCIDLAVEEKFELMNHVSHQTIVMQFMLELAKSLKVDPRACIRPFFNKFKSPEPDYQKAFQDELDSFRERIRQRAEARIQEAMQKYEEEERQKRLGPGGLDPVEVFESLPKVLQDCFEKKDLSLLQQVITTLDPKEAEYHIKRCVDSGMWVPEANKTPGEESAVKEAESESDYEDTAEKPSAD